MRYSVSCFKWYDAADLINIKFNQNLCCFSYHSEPLFVEMMKETSWPKYIGWNLNSGKNQCVFCSFFYKNTQRHTLYTRIASAGTFHFNVVHFTSHIQLWLNALCVCVCICHLIFWALLWKWQQRRKKTVQMEQQVDDFCFCIALIAIHKVYCRWTTKQKACVHACARQLSSKSEYCTFSFNPFV